MRTVLLKYTGFDERLNPRRATSGDFSFRSFCTGGDGARNGAMKLSPQSHIAVLTGAGISKESGLDTFRDTDGIWHRYSLEDVCTPEGFKRNPVLVHDFYNQRRQQLLGSAIAPNAAHTALAALEEAWPGKFTLITQNIDNLHERAGSKNILHMHGELLRVRCSTCSHSLLTVEQSTIDDICRACAVKGRMRPDIVWFNEMPYHMDVIEKALIDADLFVAIGTSGTIYPAAGFRMLAAQFGASTVEVNLEPSGQANYFTHGFYGPATAQVPLFVSQIMESI